ncbi:hydrogenase nickel incorporation protein HypB [Bacteroidales bacterium]
MCGTCGCDEDDHITYRKPSDNGQNTGRAPLALYPTHSTDTQHLTLNHSHDSSHDHHHPHEHKSITLQRNILSKNDLDANRNRGYFDALNVTSFNLVSSPGSGKTSILERTIREKGDELNCFVIEGDQQTLNDARRIENAGAPVIQVNTGNGCHLDAVMVGKAAKQLGLPQYSTLFIENVGNLVCPALFDLGEKYRIIIVSVTEGEDKPAKYPNMFETSQLCLINKADLLPYLDFDLDLFLATARKVNPRLQFIRMSAKTGEGFDEWYSWLNEQRKTDVV